MPVDFDTAVSTLLTPGTEYVRLPTLIRQVWSELPEFDREYIAQNVHFSTFKQCTYVAEGTHGFTVWFNDFQRRTEALSGEIISIPGILSDYYLISFQVDLDADSNSTDIFVRYIIAHEFAHAVLRHSQLTVCSVENNLSGPLQARTHYYHNEINADLQVFRWGFEEEFYCGQQAKVIAQRKLRDKRIDRP